MTVREQTEANERLILSSKACLSENTKGRIKKIEPCDLRTDFQRDRDRIIHSKSFRRLKHKTQVFITPQGDHYRTRLTHTLEVSQIARTIARSLRLNEDLTEAIALGHDLGHTPFGHAGEQVLAELCPLGFCHNEQSLRVVDVLENGEGINLTYEVRDGILNHTGKGIPKTLEGRIIRFADRIAYINHDIDDAIRANLLKQEDLPKEAVEVLGKTHGSRINSMILNIVQNSGDDIRMDNEFLKAMNQMRDFLFENIYIDSLAKVEEGKAKGIIKILYQKFLEKYNGKDKHRAACDYIAGMSDSYCVQEFNSIFVPISWQKM